MKLIKIIMLSVALMLPQSVLAQQLPAYAKAHAKQELTQVGSGTYRKVGLRIYNATLFAPGGEYDANKPYALKLQYKRALSKETLTGAVYDGIKEQDVADEDTLQRWKKTLDEVLPAVKNGDVILGLSVPGKDARLFYNGKEIARIREPAFADAFFGIWVGSKADAKLYAELLGNTK